MLAMPYFLMDESWYEEVEDGRYVLTDKAPEEAVRSFEEYCSRRSVAETLEASDGLTEEEKERLRGYEWD